MKRVLRPGLLQNRHGELGLESAVDPPRGDGFNLGVKTQSFHTVLIVIAESGRFPAAETVECKRYRDRDVNTDHPDFDFIGEVARGGAVFGEN